MKSELVIKTCSVNAALGGVPQYQVYQNFLQTLIFLAFFYIFGHYYV